MYEFGGKPTSELDSCAAITASIGEGAREVPVVRGSGSNSRDYEESGGEESIQIARKVFSPRASSSAHHSSVCLTV